MNKTYLPVIAFLCFIFITVSCESDRNSESEINQNNNLVKDVFANNTNIESSPFLYKKITIDSLFTISRKETPYNGDLINKYQWSDRNGLNRVILSNIYDYDDGFGKAELFGYQYIKKDNVWKRYWQMNDFVEGMGCDLLAEIKDIKIVDIDSNNIAETIILYTLDERCDAVGVSTRLLMYVESQKIAVRGISCQYLMPPEEIATKVFESDKPIKYKRIDPGNFPADTIFVKYASQFWDDFIEQENKTYEKEMEAFRKEKGYN